MGAGARSHKVVWQCYSSATRTGLAVLHIPQSRSASFLDLTGGVMTGQSRNSVGVLGVSLVGAVVLSMLFWAGSARASLPTVTEIPSGSGQHGYPYDTVPATPAIAGAPVYQPECLGLRRAGVQDLGRRERLPTERFLVIERQMERVRRAEQRAVHHPSARALPDGPGEVQRHRRGRVAERHHRRRPGPGVVRALQRAAQRGLRVRRRDRTERRHERSEDVGSAAIRGSRRQQRRPVVRHLHAGCSGREGQTAPRCSAGSRRSG